MNRPTLPDLPASPASYWLLALSGGGYKGLFTAQFLSLLEKELARPLHTAFDLTAGTSIGSILALGVSNGVATDKLVKIFEGRGEAIFPARDRRWSFITNIFRPKYSPKALRAALKAQFGQSELRSLKTPTVIPAVSLTDASARIFRTPHAADFGTHANTKLIDVALASAAAPLYFPPHQIGNTQLADGGLVANAPDALAAIEAMHVLRWPIEKVNMLSIGTTEIRIGTAFKASSHAWGALGWLRRKKLLNVLMSAQQDLARSSARLMLEKRLVLVDWIKSNEQDRAVGLDVSTSAATKTLKALADEAWQQFTRDHAATLSALKRHNAQPLRPI